MVKISWSGGKDSTASAILHCQKGIPNFLVCFIPMFTQSIPLIRKSHYEFLHYARDRFIENGVQVYFVHGITYCDACTKIIKRGKHRGKMQGYPIFKEGACHFKRDAKLVALNSVKLPFDYEDIGIACDETDRLNQLSYSKRSILVEYGITESEALKICKRSGLLSPIYDTGFRDGCILCPNSKIYDREGWFSDYPQAFIILRELQECLMLHRPESYPLRNYKYFLGNEVDQLSIFNKGAYWSGKV